MKQGRPKWNNSSKPPSQAPVVGRSFSPSHRRRAKLPDSSSDDEPFVMAGDGAQIRSRRFAPGLTPKPGLILPTLDSEKPLNPPTRMGRRISVSGDETGSRSRSASRLRDLVGQLDSLNSSLAEAHETPRDRVPTPTSNWLDAPDEAKKKKLLRGPAVAAHALMGIMNQVHMRQLANALRRLYMRPVKVKSVLENPRIAELETSNRILEGTARLVQFMSREQSLKADFINRLRLLNWASTGYKIAMLRTSRDLRKLMGFALLTAISARIEDRNLYAGLFGLYRNNQYSQLKR